jgi:hypothetical protein
VTPDEVRARLAALREAGAELRARPPQRNLEALCGVLDAWSDSRSAWRRELAAKLPEATGFAPETVREGLELALAGWNGAALERLCAELARGAVAPPEPRREVFGFETTALVLAGAIPMPCLQALVAPLALSSPVLAKPASRDPVSAELVVRSLAAADPLLGACAALAPLSRADGGAIEALLEAECVVAYGDDASVASLAARTPPSRRFVAHGHRASLALLGPGATRGRALRECCSALARDVALWDQQGCLSPIAVWCLDEDAAAAGRVAEALAAALAEAASRWPRGRVDAAAAARFAGERAEAELRAAAGTGVALHADPAGGFCVVREADARLRPAPLCRFVRVHPVASPSALRAALAPLRRHLAGVALAGFGARQGAVAQELAAFGASRVCAPGSLQAPPLSWESGGRGLLASLARFAQVDAFASDAAAGEG